MKHWPALIADFVPPRASEKPCLANRTMNVIVVSFEDFTLDPASARADAAPAAGFPDSWLDALVGTGAVFSRDYAAPGAVSTVGLHFPSSDHAEQFCLTVREAASLLGTRAHIHKVPLEQAHSTLRGVQRYDDRIL